MAVAFGANKEAGCEVVDESLEQCGVAAGDIDDLLVLAVVVGKQDSEIVALKCEEGAIGFDEFLVVDVENDVEVVLLVSLFLDELSELVVLQQDHGLYVFAGFFGDALVLLRTDGPDQRALELLLGLAHAYSVV